MGYIAGYNSTSMSAVSFYLGARYVLNGRFGMGTGPIYLSSAHCTGREPSLLQCPSIGLDGLMSCSHDDDIGLICRGD